MNRIIILSLLALLTLDIAACGHKKVKIEETKVTKNDFVKFQVMTLKDRGRKFDLELGITNISNKDIFIRLSDFQCFKGDVSGVLKNETVSPERVNLRSGQEKSFRIVCTTSEKGLGDYRFVLGRILSESKADSGDKEEVLAENVELKLEPQGK